jgi:stalled ribosome rescue protein Dom34
MSPRCYAIVWIDHREADVFRLNETEETKLVINSHTSVQRLHHQSHLDGSVHQPVDTEFFVRVVSALNHTGGTLVAGPGETKFEFERYLRRNRPDLAAHVDAIETVDHPGDAGLIALAREHFQIAE